MSLLTGRSDPPGRVADRRSSAARQNGSMPSALDYTPLLAEPTQDEVAAFRTAARASGARWASLPAAQLVALLVGGFVLLIFVVPILITMSLVTSAFLGDAAMLGFGMLFLALFAGLLVWAAIAGSRRWPRWVRLDKFARANGLVFSPMDPNPSYPGAIFQIGSDRQAVEHLRTADGRFLDLGNYRYTVGSGKNRSTRTWGFLALELDRRLPHMLLDAKANNGLFGGTNLPAAFDRTQVLSLEGDFDRFFTLYCPKEYERDALYVFTPDLMALLIDEAAPYDVEIIDDWMFVYSQAPFDALNPATYERLFRIVETVGSKTVQRTDRYADERVGDRSLDVVAPQGRRLKRGISVGAIVIAVVAVGIWVWSLLGDVIAGLLAR